MDKFVIKIHVLQHNFVYTCILALYIFRGALEIREATLKVIDYFYYFSNGKIKAEELTWKSKMTPKCQNFVFYIISQNRDLRPPLVRKFLGEALSFNVLPETAFGQSGPFNALAF